MRLEGYILASNTELIEESVQAEFLNEFQPFFRADHRSELPVITQSAPDQIIQMRWGLSNKNRPEYYSYYTDSNGIIKKPFYRILVRKSRCLIPANGILLSKYNKLFFLFSKSEKVLAIAGIYHTWKEKDSQKLISGFSIITRRTSQGLDDVSTELPVFIPKNRKRGYLKDEKPMMDILPMFTRENKDHFKMYEVRNDLLKLVSPTREDVMPLNQEFISSRKEYKTINTKRYYY